MHGASCPSIAPITCATESIPDHEHDQSITLMRLQPGISAGLGKGFQLGFLLPLDLKRSEITYRLLDGQIFEPPYGNFHHRNETLFSPGDAQLMARWTGAIPNTPLLLGFGLGATLPTGKTEEDPFKAAALEEEHQHLQFGNGTVDPLAEIQVIVRGEALGLLAMVNGRFPLYANTKGYRGAHSIGVSAGPTLRLPEPVRSVQLSLAGSFNWSSPELWDGEPGENSGLISVGLRMGLNWNPTPKLAIQANLLTRVYERSAGAQFTRPLTLTVGVSGFLNLRKLGKKARGHDH